VKEDVTLWVVSHRALQNPLGCPTIFKSTTNETTNV
jgi:hypothetical protein